MLLPKSICVLVKNRFSSNSRISFSTLKSFPLVNLIWPNRGFQPSGFKQFGSPEAGNHVQLLHTVQYWAGISALYTITLVFKFSPRIYREVRPYVLRPQYFDFWNSAYRIPSWYIPGFHIPDTFRLNYDVVITLHLPK